MLQSFRDKRVLNLAQEIDKNPDYRIPELLLKVEDILSSVSSGSKQGLEIRKDLWTLELLHLTVSVLEQDVTKFRNAWTLTSRLVRILCNACSGLHMRDCNEYHTVFLPECVKCVLTLSKKVHLKLQKTLIYKKEVVKDITECLKTSLESLDLLCSGHNFLCYNVLKSEEFLEILMTEDANIVNIITTFFQNICRKSSGIMEEIGDSTVFTLLDELIFKITSSDKPEIAWASIKTVLLACDFNPSIVHHLCTRYKGLKPLLNRWHKKGFDLDLDRLILLLEAGSLEEVANERRNRAAAKIQALWKAHKTREAIKKRNESIARFQRSFRAKRVEKEQTKEKGRLQKELQHQLLINRKQTMKKFHEKVYLTLESVPASKIEEHLESERNKAAIKIQACYRSKLSRRRFNNQKEQIKTLRAVVVLQRSIRKWLKKVLARRNEPPAWQRPPGLDDQRRVELNEKIQLYKHLHPVRN
ncbi:DgyrCDS4702 [Dimorphilus gyrociliatus]|uniref:DgyrCDS4702 n=1 Tax=Dimorphilus gyrociliatus TaxID=2664684 RepID=A0A7I8VJZ3_9ANNE|nr:DgyrCDS4702 [Dimorphilus gyrociliatus]